MRHKLIKFSKILILAAIFVGCGRFKVDKLKPQELVSVTINGDEKSLKIPMVRDLFYGIPGQVAYTEERLVVSEPSLQQIKIFQGENLELIIQAKANAEPKTPASQLNKVAVKSYRTVTIAQLQSPGNIVAGRDEDFFVMNKTVIGENTAGTETTGGYYKILHFNLKGQLQRIIGRKGQVELPFENILWIDTDRENRLWILYRHLGEMVLDAYDDGKLIYSVDQRSCVQNVFAKITKEEKDKINTCEFIYPFYRSNKVLMIGKTEKNAADRNVGGYVFQNRVFIVYDLESGSSEYIFKNLIDPDDYPYLPYDNSKIIIWQTQSDSSFKFALYDLDGDLENNLQITLPGNRTSWRNTWYSLEGKVYSTRILDNKFKVYQWK